MKRGVRMGDLYDFVTLEQKLIDILDWKNITLKGYDKPEILVSDMLNWLKEFGLKMLPYVTDVTGYLLDAVNKDKKIMFEAQLGALRDIDFGIYPYTSSSSTIAAYAPIGSGIPGEKLDRTIGIMKAYSSCVGEGPFVCEMLDDNGKDLREAGGEYGAATGRARRVGGFDVPASLYGVKVQGATELALTKLDILSYLEKIPVCVAYEVDGEITKTFPTGDKLASAKPVYEYFEGFKTDISKCRKKEDLPQLALDYIAYIEKEVGCPITYVSVGAERDAYIVMK